MSEVRSAAATHAARAIMKNFELRQIGKIPVTEKNVAIIVDVCTQIFRVENALNYFFSRDAFNRLEFNKETLEDLKDAISVLDRARKTLPSYAEETGEVIKEIEREPMSQRQLDQIALVQEKIREAKTPEEELKVLQAAGIIK